SALFSEEKFDPKAILGSNDKCLNEKMVISNGKAVVQKGSVETEQYKTCRNISGGCSLQKEKTKPDPECICGRLVFTPVGKKPIPLDKCDPDIQKKLAKAMAGGIEGMTDFAAQALISQRLQEVKVDTQDGRDQLSQILQNYGLSKDEADAKVNDEDKAATVQEQLKKFVSTSDTDEASKIAGQLGFTLNKDLIDEVRLDHKKFAGVLTEGDLERFQTALPDTFLRDLGDAVPQVLSRDVLYSGQGGCYAVSNSYGTFRPCVLTQDQVTQVRGNIIPQIASVYWEGNQRADGRAFNANELGVAHQTLPLGTQVLVYNPQTGQAVVATVNDRGPFVSGRDIDLSRGTANAIGFNGVGAVHTVVLGSSMPTGSLGRFSSVAEAFQAYQQSNGAIAVGAGDIAPGVPRNTSPFANLLGGSTGGYVNTSSPFSPPPAPVGQPASYSQPQQTTPASQNQNVAQPPVVASQPRPLTPTSTVAEDLARAIQDPSAANVSNRLANIVVEQTEVRRGDSVQVSWTSIGMSTDKPCELRAGSNVIARMNRGTATVGTSAATRVGSLVFYLRCTTASGVTFQRTAAVMVR
ncbi:MAG: septal ring lytic transglycosylase RlpA family protein, partial [bacterium]|nr:septal ring lytic transglycosylase RlpA family protein [bacterium]